MAHTQLKMIDWRILIFWASSQLLQGLPWLAMATVNKQPKEPVTVDPCLKTIVLHACKYQVKLWNGTTCNLKSWIPSIFFIYAWDNCLLLNIISFWRRRLCPAVQSLTFLYTILNRKGNPLIKPPWKNAALLRTMHMFMLTIMFFNLWTLFPFIYLQPEEGTAMFWADPCPCTCVIRPSQAALQMYIPLWAMCFSGPTVWWIIPESWDFCFQELYSISVDSCHVTSFQLLLYHRHNSLFCLKILEVWGYNGALVSILFMIRLS